MTARTTTWIQHNRIRLALHELQSGDGRPLLLLHGLGESTPDAVPTGLRWPGPVLGLDFTGHGESTVPVGGGYTAEILVADVDAVIARVGSVTIVGRGLGAYIGLLVTGARPELVRGLALTDGPGLVGGGTEPGSAAIVYPETGRTGAPDPFALVELSRDPRPESYVQNFMDFILDGSDLAEPVNIDTALRPPWIEALLGGPGVSRHPLAVALERFAAVP